MYYPKIALGPFRKKGRSCHPKKGKWKTYRRKRLKEERERESERERFIHLRKIGENSMFSKIEREKRRKV